MIIEPMRANEIIKQNSNQEEGSGYSLGANMVNGYDLEEDPAKAGVVRPGRHTQFLELILIWQDLEPFMFTLFELLPIYQYPF